MISFLFGGPTKWEAGREDFEPWKGRSRRVYGSAWGLGLDVAGGKNSGRPWEVRRKRKTNFFFNLRFFFFSHC